MALNGKRPIAATIFILLASVVCLANPQESAPSITKVEPPSWWANHTINPVRLLIRGSNLFGARVKATRPQTAVSDVRINSAGTYIFVSVRINPLAKPGDYPLVVETAQGKASAPFHLNTALDPKQNFQGITTDDVIYLIMTDRFSDGDVANNVPAGSPPGAFDRRNARAYHGGDLRGVINRLPYLKDLGVTAIWLTPWYDNWNGVKTCDKPWCPSTYYHGYHAIDYYGVEDHFGDMQTLRELVARAHGLGLKIIQDQVANHVGSQHPWADNPPLDNWFHGTLQNHLLEKFHNSTVLSPHANREEVQNTLDGWFSDDMPDMNQEEPEVARYENQNSLWWAGMTGIDGIRQDTIQYIPRFFIHNLSAALDRQYPRMWMVGEVFERDVAQTAFFIGGHRGWDGVDTKLDSVFDFSLWSVSLDVFTGKKPMRALRDQLKYDALYPDPSRVTTLLNNHDTRRFMSIEGATLEGAMLHTAFMLTVRGTPQLYAGEEIALEGKDDPDNRRDFPGGFPGDNRNAFSANQRTSDEQRMWQWTHDWIKLRREHSAIRRGHLIDLFYDDDVYAYARQDSRETVIILINRSSKERNIKVPTSAIGLRDGTQLSPLYIARAGLVLQKGEASIIIPPGSAIAYRN
ncbi:MAG: alpha-amylase family glycosyl hydrolase [Pyrinomonadaceae bacterium]